MNSLRPCVGIASDHAVYLYSILNATIYPKAPAGLTNSSQTKITSIKWSPFGNAVLAVGCG
jgi:hypothetical protein